MNDDSSRPIRRGCSITVYPNAFEVAVGGMDPEEGKRKFSRTGHSLEELRQWLVSSGVTFVAIKSQDGYWSQIQKALDGHIPDILLIGNHGLADVSDSDSTLEASQLEKRLQGGAPGGKAEASDGDRRFLMRLLERRKWLGREREKSLRYMTRIFRRCAIGLPDVVGDITCGTAAALIDMMCQGRQITLDDVEGVRADDVEASSEELLEACTGLLCEHDTFLLGMIRDEVLELQWQIDHSTMLARDFLGRFVNPRELALDVVGKAPKLGERDLEGIF